MLDNEKRENGFNDGQENDNNDFNQMNDRANEAENIFAEEDVRMPEANDAGQSRMNAESSDGAGQNRMNAESSDGAGQNRMTTEGSNGAGQHRVDVESSNGAETRQNPTSTDAQVNSSMEQGGSQSSVYRKVQSEIPYARFDENARGTDNEGTTGYRGGAGTAKYSSGAGTVGREEATGYRNGAGTVGNGGTYGYGSSASAAGNGGVGGYGNSSEASGNDGNTGYGNGAETVGSSYGGYAGRDGYGETAGSNGYSDNASYNQASAGHDSSESRQYSYMPNDEQPQDRQPRHNTRSRRRKQKKHMNNYAKAIACAVLCGLIIGGCVLGSFAIGKNMTSGSSNSAGNTDVTTTEAKLSESSSDYEATQTSSTSGTYTVAQIANECGSSVVAITNKSVSEVQTMFGVYTQESEGSGSGVIISKTDTELLIVTNYHVIEDAEELSVCFNDSADAVYTAQIKGTDSENDLAVVAVALSDISEDVLNSISIATIGDSDSLEVGDGVVAIGNALGLGQSVTSGIISALDREVTLTSTDSSSESTTANLLQTDAAINPGNSGGALFNMNGELIGINSAKYASEEVEGMGFAIPMSTAKPIIEELMTKETRTKLTENYGCLNITGSSVSSDASEMYGVPEGVYVSQVLEDGAAGKAGIQTGDIITSLDGNSVSSIEDLQDELQYYAAGETVEVVIQRNDGNGYAEQTLTVTLDNASEQDSSAFDSSSGSSQDSQSSQDGQNSYGSDDSSGYYYYNYGDSGNSGFSVR